MERCAVERKKINKPFRATSTPIEDDSAIMAKIRSILGRGNNAEVKRTKNGVLTVMEVKKNIV